MPPDNLSRPPNLTILHAFFKHFFDIKKKHIFLSYFGPRRFLGPTCPFSDPNLTPKIHPKSVFMGVQEGTYLKIPENVKIASTLKRKPHFGGPGTPGNRLKIAEKSIPRASHVKVHFQDLQKTPPAPSRGPLGGILNKNVNFQASKLGLVGP